MNCQHCGNEIADGAVFCKYCGKRTDGLKTCPVCKKDIDYDSLFCSFCGADLAAVSAVSEAAASADGKESAVHNQAAPAAATSGATAAAGVGGKTAFSLTRILNIAAVACSALVALFALIFIFFAGYKSIVELSGQKVTSTADIFYFFGKAYKDRAEAIKLMQPSNYYKAATFLPCIFGTVISAASLIAVCVLVVLSTVYNVQYVMGKSKKSGEAFAIAAFAVFVFCSAALLAMVNSTAEYSSGYQSKTIYYELSSATVAGIVLGCVFTAIWLCCKIAVCGKQFFQTANIVKCCLALAGTVFTVVAISLLTLPAITIDSSEAGITDVKCGVLQLLNSLGLLSFKGVGNELAAKTWVVFGLGIFAFFATIAAIICGGEFIIKAINNISGNGKRSLLGASVRTAVFVLFAMVLVIVCGEMVFDIALEIGDSQNDSVLYYGVPIAAFVLSVVAMAIAIAFKIYSNKSAARTAAAEASIAEGAENTQH